METYFVILAITILAIFILIAAIWIYEHRCSICGNIHNDKDELKKCTECGKLFCKDKSTQHELIKSNIKGVLGSGIYAQVEKEIEYHGDYSCGYIYIETNSEGSVFSNYCRIHDPRLAKI